MIFGSPCVGPESGRLSLLEELCALNRHPLSLLPSILVFMKLAVFCNTCIIISILRLVVLGGPLAFCSVCNNFRVSLLLC